MDTAMEIENYKKQIDEALTSILALKYPEVLYEAMGYSVFAGGKRLRPILILAACKAVGGECGKAMPFACAMEMLHTYSLIHDDLPAMDDDDFRRGRPTNHKVFGEAIAILSGDGLLNLAYETMAQACLASGEPGMVAAMAEIAQAAGACGMIGGQVVDVISENKKITDDTLLYIHANKTAALIKASLKAGALIGGGSSYKLDILEQAGIKLGMAFQIKDDILDVTSTQAELGKPINSDSKKNKPTYVSVYGLERAQKDYETLSQQALLLLEEASDPFLIAFATILFGRKA